MNRLTKHYPHRTVLLRQVEGMLDRDGSHKSYEEVSPRRIAKNGLDSIRDREGR